MGGWPEVIGDAQRGGVWFPYVLLAFLAVNLALVASTGVRVGGDTPLYVDGARALLDGAPLVGRQPSYLGYVTIVSIAQWTGVGLTGLVLLQVAAATLAAAVVYRIGVELGGTMAGLLAVGLLTLDVETNRWHAYVLADSLYASLFTVAAWLVYRAGPQALPPSPRLRRASKSSSPQALPPSPRLRRAGKPSGPQALKPYAAAAVLLLAAALVRPEGWFLIPAAAIYWVLRGVSRPSLRWASLAGVVACCVLLVLMVAPRLSGNVQAVGPGEMLRSGQTIWDYDGWRLAMPPSPVSDAAWGSAGSAVSYAVAHPVSTLTLMAARIGVHFAHVRPFYSMGHNALIVAWLLPVYVVGAVAGFRLRHHVLARWCAVAIGTQALVVALTHADWDGRYLAHVLPLWYPLAASGIVLLMARWRGVPAGEVARG